MSLSQGGWLMNNDFEKTLTQITTNYDYIINLEINELAEYMYHLTENYDKCDICVYDGTEKCDDHVCVGGIIKYLCQKHKNDGDEL